jgi:pyruvate formate lyase activating enzyme
MKGNIFNIQKLSLHDGPGIRTVVFMKGCPLRCSWCSNPESQQGESELAFLSKRCIQCGVCQVVCCEQAISEGTFAVDYHRCTACGVCADECCTNAKQILGKKMTVEEVMDEIKRAQRWRRYFFWRRTFFSI